MAGNHGGKRPGAGLKPYLREDQRRIHASIRLTPARRLKLRALGSAWLDRKIDEEPDAPATIEPKN